MPSLFIILILAIQIVPLFNRITSFSKLSASSNVQRDEAAEEAFDGNIMNKVHPGAITGLACSWSRTDGLSC